MADASDSLDATQVPNDVSERSTSAASFWREKLASCKAIARGAARAIRDPRELARLTIARPEELDRRYEAEARELFGELPRAVPIEALIGQDLGTLETFSFLDDTSTVLDLLLLRGLTRRRPSSRYFEIGTFRGESAVAVADVASEVVTLSLSDDQMLSLGADSSFLAAHRVFSDSNPKVRHIFADSSTFDVTPFLDWADVLFIDGDHARPAVENDTRRFLPVVRRGTGVVVWHDAFLSPLRPRWEVLAGIGAALSVNQRKNLVHVANTLVVALIPGADTIPTIELSYVPKTVFSVAVTTRPMSGAERQS